MNKELYKKGTRLLCKNIDDNLERDDIIVGKIYTSLGINRLDNVDIINEWDDQYGYFPWRFEPLIIRIPNHIKII